MKCHYCGKENEHLALVNSMNMSNTLVLSCLECSKEKKIDVDHIHVDCNRCEKHLMVGKLGNVYMENLFADTFVIYCRKCSLIVNFEFIKKIFRFINKKNEKRVAKSLKKSRIFTFFKIQGIHKKITRLYPYIDLFLFADKKGFLHIIPNDRENYDEISATIDKLIGEYRMEERR